MARTVEYRVPFSGDLNFNCRHEGPESPGYRNESFDFLGYTVGGKDRRIDIYTWPLKKAVRALLMRIHERTTPQSYAYTPLRTVARISARSCAVEAIRCKASFIVFGMIGMGFY